MCKKTKENLLLIIYFFIFAALLTILIMKYRLFSLLFLFQLLSLNAIGQESTDTLVGHSLGGEMAAANACKTGRDAMTFNAAWVSPATIGPKQRQSANIDAYVNVGDELYYIQMRTLRVRANGNFHWRYGRRSLLGHSIKNFYSSDSKVFNQYFKSIQSLYIQNSSFSPFTF